jgi:GT2 family glycosyltransferase
MREAERGTLPETQRSAPEQPHVVIPARELTVSLVLYRNDPEVVTQAISSVLNSPLSASVLVVDNSPTADLRKYLVNPRVQYVHNDGNVGFGKAHNRAIRECRKAEYHLVLNPDVYFDPDVLPAMLKYMDEHAEVGLMSPKICYPDGQMQYLCKRYPSFLALFGRRFLPGPFKRLIQQRLDAYEMRETGYDKIIDVPYLSGCFMLFRRRCLEEIGMFDENFFLHLEDADITYRMQQRYRAIFFPFVTIKHHWGRGSHRSLYMTWVTIRSAFYFFRKHGWRW